MNLDTVISKLETIVSRIHDPIHISGYESVFEGYPLPILYPVEEIYVFGSAVYVDDPRDLDLNIVTGRSKFHVNFVDEKYKKAKNEYWRWYSYDKMVKNILLKKMRNVDIQVDNDHLVTDLKILVWSTEKPNVKENFLTGRQNVDLTGECRNLRKQLKTATAESYVLQEIYRMYSNEDKLSEIKRLQCLDGFFTKKDLPRLKLFYEENDKRYQNSLDLAVLKNSLK
ncbi:unnamed protein product [marine sediment metagenome]|uniref:Uncharacterized protein n=1 Tax=marine sediment metagenome TaxID=412755 RepID=X1DBX2_9ZZZZ